MDIKTLENGDRLLTLSAYERDTLIEVATYLRDHYEELDENLRSFSYIETENVIQFLGTIRDNIANVNMIILKSLDDLLCYSSEFLIDTDCERHLDDIQVISDILYNYLKEQKQK